MPSLPSVAPPVGLCFLQWEDTVGSWGPHRYEVKPLRAYMRSMAAAEHDGPIISLQREPFKDRDGDVRLGAAHAWTGRPLPCWAYGLMQ